MKRIQKLKDFIWNDLPLRLSTHIVILAGLLPIIFCYVIICYFLKYNSYDGGTPIAFLLYLSSIIPIAITIVFILFIIENMYKNFRLNFTFFQSKIFKIITLSLYAISIACTYVVPGITILFNSI